MRIYPVIPCRGDHGGALSEADFTRDGYTLLNRLIDLEQVVDLKDHIFDTLKNDRNLKSDGHVPRAPAKYGDPVTDRLLEQLLPKLEPAHCSLLPTYSYWRVYRRGDCLKKHRDRPACEISLTLSIDYDGESPGPWPILLQNAEGEHSIEVHRGCGLLYKGTEIYHWREACTPLWAVQVFLHYVDRDGPFQHHRFDGREALGLPPAIQQPQVQTSY
jgi:hypothetical protein